MLFQIAWRNIWRNKSRSLVVISSIIIGVWAGIFILSFAWGMYKNNINESVYRQLSHIQIHHPTFGEENDSKFTITNTDEKLKQFQSNAQIASVSSRVIATGMVASPTTASGVKIYGINPASEISQIRLNESVREGTYFDSGKDNEILIGEKLARKLKIKLKSKVASIVADSNQYSLSFPKRLTLRS